MKIWAHRGCSLRYPENTLLAFEKAAALAGLEGIETDVQLTRDGQIVILHDERLDRTTEMKCWVKDYTLAELKSIYVKTAHGEFQEKIPTLEEVLDLLKDRMKEGLRLNIELKNSEVEYPGLEEKVIETVDRFGLSEHILYSSFNAQSLGTLRRLLPDADIGMLSDKASDCLKMMSGPCRVDAIHPCGEEIDLPPEKLAGMTVRAWFTGPLYPEKGGERMNLTAYEAMGVTDVFINDPEEYL